MTAAARPKAPALNACALSPGKVFLGRFLPDGNTADIAVVLSPGEARELATNLLSAAEVASRAPAAVKVVQP